MTFLRKETQWTAEDRGHRVALSFLVSGIVVALPLRGIRGKKKEKKKSSKTKLGVLDRFPFSSENCHGINTVLTVHSFQFPGLVISLK